MPPRLNKRQQREQEELLALGGPSREPLVSSEDEGTGVPTPYLPGTGFAALSTPAEGDVDSTDEDSSRPTTSRKPKKKKSKKKRVLDSPLSAKEEDSNTGLITDDPRLPRNPTSHPKNDKKATKRAKAKERKASKNELDKALAELSIKYPELQNISAATATSATSFNPDQSSLSFLLSVSLPHLDSDTEMRKFFGAKVVSANKSLSSSPSGSSSRKQPGTQRSHLTRPQPSWWRGTQREGLSIRQLTEEQLEDKMDRQSWKPIEEKWWNVEYSKKYKSLTLSFLRDVMSGDPEGFWNVLGRMPWHADTLLQVSEVFRHREEHSQAMDFVERALYTYERSFIGAFNFTSGLNRLDFDHVENRPFFLAVHRQVIDLQRKGCVRTAFEFARLMYSLDPWNDPHGALFHLDFLAIKAGMSEWLLDVIDHFETRRKTEYTYASRMDPSLLPGWAYARALALRIKENTNKDKFHEKSTTALKEALLSFPSVVILLADKLDLSLPPKVRSHSAFRIQTGTGQSSPDGALHLMSHLYVQRSFPLWKDPEISAWFENTVVAISPTISSTFHTSDRRRRLLDLYTVLNLRYSAYRHIMILGSGYQSLISFIPREILNAKSLACDPLPPPTAVSQYDDEFFKGTENSPPRSRQDLLADERMFQRLVPDALFRAQLQAFFDAHPNLRERFPDGIVQFAEMARQLPENELVDMMLVEAIGEQIAEIRGMPGQMPGQHAMFMDLMEDDGEPRDGQAGVPLPVQGLDEDPPEGDQGQEASEGEIDVEDSEDETIAPLPVRLLRNLMNRFWARNDTDENSSDNEDTERDDRQNIPFDDSDVD